MGLIYVIRYKPEGAEYVGQTTQDLSDRIHQHLRSDSLLGDMIRSHGEESFDVRVLCYCPDALLNEAEQKAIESLGTLFPKGMNKTLGGSGAYRNRTQLERHNMAKEFCRRGHHKGKWNSCGECIREKDRQRYHRDKEKRLAAQNARKAKIPKTCRECGGSREKRSSYCLACKHSRRVVSYQKYYGANRHLVIAKAAKSKAKNRGRC